MEGIMETMDISGIEIFSNENMPNGHEYTEKDLEEIVNGFHTTKNELKPYLKFGHDNKQKLAQDSGMPALGWVENLRKVGNKLVADFVKIPKTGTPGGGNRPAKGKAVHLLLGWSRNRGIV